MNKEQTQRIMNRVLDGVATTAERQLLAGAMRADPLLRQEFEELELTHRATEGLFRRLALPRSFSRRIMQRVQEDHVPTDTAPRIPEFRPRELRRMRLSRARRNRTRIFGVVAGVSAAAAVLLAAGVFTGFFARNGIGQDGTPDAQDKHLADGREGVPPSEEFDRTVSSTRQPIQDGGGAGDADDPQPEPRRVPTREPADEAADVAATDNRDHEPDVDESPEPRPEAPSEPDPSEERPVIEDDEPRNSREEGDNQPEEPGGTLLDEPERDRTEARGPAHEPGTLGTLTILSGRVELQTPGGEWIRAEDNAELRKGAHLKTSTSGIVLVCLDGGCVTLGKRSEASLIDATRVDLKEGSAGLDRRRDAAGESLGVRIDDYNFTLNHGAAVLERKYRGFQVVKTFGAAILSHDELGVLDFGGDQPGTADIKFGQALPDLAGGDGLLPDWSADSRAWKVMQNLDAVLAARDFASRERAYVDRNLPRGLQRVMQYAVSCDSVEDFLKAAIGNTSLDGRTLKRMLDELEIVFLDESDLDAEQITQYAEAACAEAGDFGAWRNQLNLLMHPPAGHPHRGKPNGHGKRDHPDYPDKDKDKVKRVDRPKHRGAKPPGEDRPEED